VFFFQRFAPGASAADTTGWQATFFPQIPLSLGDGVTMQSGDACHLLNTAAANLRGEQTREKSSHSFVGHSAQAIDRPMLKHHCSTLMLLAHGTFTGMNRSSMKSNHMNLPP
jgi:hypothetical protein